LSRGRSYPVTMIMSGLYDVKQRKSGFCSWLPSHKQNGKYHTNELSGCEDHLWSLLHSRTRVERAKLNASTASKSCTSWYVPIALSLCFRPGTDGDLDIVSPTILSGLPTYLVHIVAKTNGTRINQNIACAFRLLLKFASKIYGLNASGRSRCLEGPTIQRPLTVQLGKWQRCSSECDATESRVSRIRKSVVLPAHAR
jgi:hypothetical protein